MTTRVRTVPWFSCYIYLLIDCLYIWQCFQKRNVKTNVKLILFPFVLCILLSLMQRLIDNQFDKAKYKCGCICTNTQGDQCLEKACGIQYSDFDQVGACPIANPSEWPPLLQVPAPEYRAARTDFLPSDFPNPSCRTNGSCPVTLLFTGNNQSLGQSMYAELLILSKTSESPT